MRQADRVRWVLRAIGTSPLRSILTAIGIAIGICAVTLLTSIGEGIRLYLVESFSQFGTRIVAVTPGRTTTQGAAGMLSTIRPLSLDDAELLGSLPHVEAVVPVVHGTAKVEADRFARDTYVHAVGPDMARAWRFEIGLGRFLPAGELQGARYFAVLGAKVRQELYGKRNPLGDYVRIGGTRFQVIGVMKPKGQLLGFDLDDAVFIPAELGLMLFNREGLMEVDVIFRPSTTSAAISAQIRQRLGERHGEEDFTLLTQEDMLATLNKILNVVKIGVGAIGGVALLVGGVGVLTIMTTALSERIAEIGLLRALGCTRRQILLLFLGEAMLLAAAGGLLGLSAVVALILLLQTLAPGLPVALEPAYLLLSLLLSTLIGLAAGIVPALNAARLDPVTALRSE